MNKTLCLLGSAILIPALVLGQGTPTEKKPVPRGKTFMIRLENDKGLNTGKAASPDVREILSLKKEDVLELVSEAESPSGVRHQKYRQYTKGIPVEYGTVSALSRQGRLESLSGELYDIPDGLSPVPSISESAALEAALNFVHARKTGDAAYPGGELVYVRVYIPNGNKKKNDMALAYKFDIYQEQVPARDYVFVDAHEGIVIHKDPILKHADAAPAATRYSGVRTISTAHDDLLQAYVLKDDSRGQGIETYSVNHRFDYTVITPFTDADNQWTAAEFDNVNKDNAALDAHWGAMMTYDYFKNNHGRDSYDDQGARITSYVHYGVNYVNAFWDGTVMTYGDGSLAVDPLTTLDICGHEIAHAVCTATANLVYQDESGALNEGLSDIWGSMIERYAAPEKSVWDLGEDSRHIFRSLSDPNAHFQPDTYEGDFWYRGADDSGGVHTNSGVLNHWYYLLVTGETGVNDHGTNYNVQGIGFEAAARIVYEMEGHHLTANSTYADARLASLQAATDLFGAQSNEFQQTLRAWDAVGVYDDGMIPPASLEAHVASATGIALSWTDPISGETSFVVERSLRANGGFAPIGTVGENATTYADDGLAPGIYYYRVKALLEDDRSTMPSAVAAVVLGVQPLVMAETEVTTCDAIFLDPGGIGNYGDHETITMVIRPADAGKKIQVSFSTFSLSFLDNVLNNDKLEIFDGDNVHAPPDGGFMGTVQLRDIMATSPSGALTFRFTSHATTGFGWQAQVSCISIPETPVNLTATPVSGTQINLAWEDHATTETGYRVERGFPPDVPFHEIAALPANTTSYEDAGLSPDNAYTYHVYAAEGTLRSAYSNQATATIGRAPLRMSEGTVSTCGTSFVDPGGGENYPDGMALVMILTPTIPGTKMAITFSEFDLGPNFFDMLSIFDGPLVRSFKGNNLPPRVVSSAADGSLKFEFVSGLGGGHGSGWRAEITCLTPPAAPTGLVATATGSDAVHLTWVDHADDETGYIVERAIGGHFNIIATLDANTQMYNDAGLPTDTEYSYRVWSEIDDELFSPSNVSTVALGVQPPPPLAVENDPGNFFKVRPNPASETIQITSDVHAMLRLSLIDVLGRTCLQTSPAQADYVLDVQALSPGIYTLVIQAEHNISVTRRIQILR